MPINSSANRSLRKLKTYLGRVIRDIERPIVGNEDLREAFVRQLFLARRVLEQERRQRGRKVYSVHAPEVRVRRQGQSAPAAGNLSPMLQHCPAIPMTGTRCSLYHRCRLSWPQHRPLPITSSRSTRGARSAASRRREYGVPPLSPSSAISSNITAWAAITSST